MESIKALRSTSAFLRQKLSHMMTMVIHTSRSLPPKEDSLKVGSFVSQSGQLECTDFLSTSRPRRRVCPTSEIGGLAGLWCCCCWLLFGFGWLVPKLVPVSWCGWASGYFVLEILLHSTKIQSLCLIAEDPRMEGSCTIVQATHPHTHYLRHHHHHRQQFTNYFCCSCHVSPCCEVARFDCLAGLGLRSSASRTAAMPQGTSCHHTRRKRTNYHAS